MSRNPLYVGIGLAIVGVLIIFLSSYQVGRPVTIMDSAFEVKAFGWYAHSAVFAVNKPLHISFEVTQGSLDFMAMGQENFALFNSSQSYEYYTATFRPSVTHADFEWRARFLCFNIDLT